MKCNWFHGNKQTSKNIKNKMTLCGICIQCNHKLPDCQPPYDAFTSFFA